MQNCKTLLLFEQMAYFIMHYRVTLQNIQMLLGFQKYFFIHMHWNPKMDIVILIHTTSKDTNIVNNSNDIIFIKDNTTMIVTPGLIDIENVEKSDNSNVTYSDFQAKSIETNALNCNHDIATTPALVRFAGINHLQQYMVFLIVDRDTVFLS